LRDGGGFLRPAWCTYAAVTASSCVIPYKWYSDNQGGVNTSDADISSWGPGRLDIFARGSDGYLWHRYWNYGSWGGWDKMPGPSIVGGPGAVSWGSGRIDVVARTNDANNSLTHWYWTGSSWVARTNDANNTLTHWYWNGTWGYDNLGGVNTSDPDIASTGPNNLAIFAKGSDNAIWQKKWNGSGWTGWTSMGGPVIGGPGAVSWDEGVAWDEDRIDVVARNTDANSTINHWYWLP
jgi:hypothetical protein